MRRMFSKNQIEKMIEQIADVDWLNQLKSIIEINDDGDLEVSAMLKNDSLVIDFPNGEIFLDSIGMLVDEDEEPFFPALDDDNAGKLVAVNEDETGFEYVDAPNPFNYVKYEFEATKVHITFPSGLIPLKARIGSTIITFDYTTGISTTSTTQEDVDAYTFQESGGNSIYITGQYSQSDPKWIILVPSNLEAEL